MRVAFLTLGCKVNQQETAALQQLFAQRGYTVCAADEPADICIVNSCTVTAAGEHKSLQWLRRAKRTNGALTVLTGCYPQAYPQQAAVQEADIVAGNTQRGELVDLVEEYLRTRRPLRRIVPHAPAERFEELPPARPLGHTRSFLKVEDGCDRACAYCVIPTARGQVRSRPLQGVLSEVAALAAGGCCEFVLSGINLSRYGRDLGLDLATLAEQVAAVPGVRRLRLGSLEPDLVSRETWQRLAALPQLCEQFHLSLQSGCDATLQRMRRHYTAAQYADTLALVRSLFDAPAFTTDVIVGFPGEDEAEFAESLRFVEACGFLKVHVFSYSPRPGTAAASFPQQVAPPIKAERSRRLADAAGAARAKLLAAAEGIADEVLLEAPAGEGLFTGYTRRYLPVLVAADGRRQGEVVPVRLGRPQGARVAAQLL